MKNNLSYTSDWKKLSKKILSERPKCELCKIRGIDKDSEETHHIFKFAEQLEEDLAKELMLDEDNLIAVCKECHKHIHKQNWYLWPEQRNYLNQRKNEISQKYLDQGKIVLWVPDLTGRARKQKSFIEAPVFK